MGGQNLISKITLLCLLLNNGSSVFSIEVCSSTFLPGSKGDPGEVGDEGFEGRLGKTGPPGLTGLSGENGEKGEAGRMGKMGLAGERGRKGERGNDGPQGTKGKPEARALITEGTPEVVHESSTTCDCGRYRKVVGQMDINIGKLKNAIKFLKHVVLGIRETEDKFYLVVKEERRYRDALANCRLRGGTLATPRNIATNTLLANYIREVGLTHVLVGPHLAEDKVSYVDTDGSPLQNSTSWGLDLSSRAGNDVCVQMGSDGVWSQTKCDVAKYFLCEVLKK